MNIQTVLKVPPASHTFHSSWGQCPRKAWHTHIARDVERDDTAALSWGRHVHEALDKHLATGEPLPDELKYCANLYNFPPGYKLQTELQLAITRKMRPCEFRADDCFARGVIDVAILMDRCPQMALIVDHKTGKVREDPNELEFHAVLLQAHYPELLSIKGWYNWLAQNRMGIVHDLSDTQKTFQRLLQLHDRIQSAFKLGANAFPPRQGPLCTWCPVKQCEFHP